MPPSRRRSRTSDSPPFTSAASDVASARPRNPIATRHAQADVDRNRNGAEHHRHAALRRARRRSARRSARLNSRPGQPRSTAARPPSRRVGRQKPCRVRTAACTISVASTISPTVAGHVHDQHHARPRETVPRIACGSSHRRVTRDRRQHGRRDRDAEQPDRQIHQAERVLQPRHGAGALAGREQRVDEQIDLRRGEAERARPIRTSTCRRPASRGSSTGA